MYQEDVIINNQGAFGPPVQETIITNSNPGAYGAYPSNNTYPYNYPNNNNSMNNNKHGNNKHSGGNMKNNNNNYNGYNGYNGYGNNMSPFNPAYCYGAPVREEIIITENRYPYNRGQNREEPVVCCCNIL